MASVKTGATKLQKQSADQETTVVFTPRKIDFIFGVKKLTELRNKTDFTKELRTEVNVARGKTQAEILPEFEENISWTEVS